MSLASAAFAGFVLVVVSIYYLLPLRGQNVWLLLASYVFLISWAWPFAAVLLASTLINYAIGRRLSAQPGRRNGLLWLGIAVNVAALLHFKNAAYYVPELLGLAARLGLFPTGPALQFLIPLGVSYYSLQAISYLVDVHRGLLPPAARLVDFSLYMAYFPKLVAGPIERARTFLPKLAQPRVVDNAVLARSATLIVVGVVRKIVFADTLTALIPATAIFQPAAVPGSQMALYLLAYAFALYNDFAGYTSIVRGVSGLFGLELSPNFMAPYFSRTFTEFWNRWHISLSHWLRDYIYFPLSRVLVRRFPNRRHIVNLVVPPLATMLASAAWHATWEHKTMFLWGLLHGLYLIGERVVWLNRPLQPPDNWRRHQQVLGIVIVFTLTTLAWVPFGEGSGFRQTVSVWLRLVDLRSWLVVTDLRILLVVIPALWVDWLQWRQQDEAGFLRWPLLARSAALTIAILAILASLSSGGGSIPFVYQAF